MTTNYLRLREVRKARRVLGLCVECGEKANHWRCVECQSKHTTRQAGIYHARIANGLCGRCGKSPKVGERSTCEPCAAYLREAVARHQAKYKRSA